MPTIRLLVLIVSLLISQSSLSRGQARVEKNVVVGMYSGLALVMDVHYPENPNGFGIISIAGSGWTGPLAYNATQLSRYRHAKVYVPPLIERGYTVFSLNHRTTPRFQFPAPLHDVQRAVRFIRFHSATFNVNPDRIGAVGGSSGGHLVSLLGTLDGDGNPDDPDPVNRQSAKVQTVVSWAAPAALDHKSNKYATLLVGAIPPMDDSNSQESQLYRAASPINFVSSDDSPFLLLHGDKDDVVPFEQGELMRDALIDAGVENQLLRIPGGGHGATFYGAENPPDYFEAMVKWFDQHLKQNVPDRKK